MAHSDRRPQPARPPGSAAQPLDSAADPQQATEDARFLAQEFDIPAPQAEKLTGAPSEAIRHDIGAEDPLAVVPLPEAPASDVTPDADEERLKPVLHQRNDRTGGG